MKNFEIYKKISLQISYKEKLNMKNTKKKFSPG